MPASAEKLLELLQERKLLPPTMINSLRRQVADAPEMVTAHHIAKLLQRKGKITAFQARELLAEVEGRAVGAEPTESTTASSAAPPAEDELGLADDDEPKRTALRSSPPPAATPADKSAAEELEAPAALSDGLDSLLDDALMETADPLQPAAGKTLLAMPKRGKRVAMGWDSPMIIVGGGILLLLLMIGAILAFVLTRSSGDELYAAAEQDYLDGAYGQAISKFERFVGRHGSHPDVSMARVRIALAKLRIETTAQNWPAALQRAQEVLPEIATEPALEKARPELSALLPDIAEGIAESAAAETDTERAAEVVAQFEQAMELVNDPTYLPASQRASQSGRIERSREMVAAVVRTLEEQSRLKQTIIEINTLASGENAMQAYAKRDELLKLYPRLHDNPELAAAVSGISNELAKQVQLLKEVIPAVNEERPSPVVAEVALADVTGEEVIELKNHVAPFVIDGVLYVLQAETGRLLWRRFVGGETLSAAPVSSAPGADVIVADTVHHDLLRLRASDGELVWRLPVGSAFQFVVGPEQIWLALEEGELWNVDPTTGNCGRQVRYPQPLAAAPRITERGHIIQVADHSNIYVLDAASLQCVGVYLLGHARGTVRYPPVATAGIVAVPHQVGLRRSLLHILRETDESPHLEAAQAAPAMEGQFGSPLVSQGLRIAAFDQHSKLTLWEVDPAKQDVPVQLVSHASGGDATVATHAGMREGYLLVGAHRLAAYRVAGARGNLSPRWINHNGDEFVAPIQLLDNYVLHARRTKGRAGVIIAATARDAAAAQDAGRPIWENIISPGGPKSGWRRLDDDSLIAHSSLGHTYEIALDLTQSQALNVSAMRAVRPGDYQAALSLNAQRAVLIAAGQPPLADDHQILFPAPLKGDLSALEFENAVVWRGGLLTPSKLGRVELLPTNPASLSLFPFQPKLELGTSIEWLRPAVVDDQQVAIANRRGELYLVGINNGGAPHLAATAQTQMPLPPVAAPLLFGKTIAVITRGQQQDAIITFELPSLSGESQADLPGRLRWGPYVLGDTLLLATMPGDLQAYTPGGELRWTFGLRGKLPIGAPAQNGEEIAIATTDGNVFQLRLEDGKLARQTDVAQPLGDGPLYAGSRFALRSVDGSVLFVAGE